jgi:hypothetical protein
VITVIIAVSGNLTQSVWEQAIQVIRWYSLFVGVTLVREHLPLYIAHGQTRRQFGAQATVTVALFAPFLSVLLVVGYLLAPDRNFLCRANPRCFIYMKCQARVG